MFAQLDNIAKKLVPSLYAIVLLVVYSLHQEDGYSGTTTPMYERHTAPTVHAHSHCIQPFTAHSSH
jgi:hypothetical protein